MRKINHDIEREFENLKAKGGDSRNYQSNFYFATNISTIRNNLNSFKKIKDKKILEIDCLQNRIINID